MYMCAYIYIYVCVPSSWVGIATDYGLDCPGSNPSGDDIFHPSRPGLGPTQPPVKMGTGSFPGVKYGRDVLLTTHNLLVPQSWKSRAIPLPTLWATPGLWREHFTCTFLYIYIYVLQLYIYIYIYIRSWNTPLSKNLEEEETVDDPGNDGNASMPEQVKQPNPWRKMMMMMIYIYI